MNLRADLADDPVAAHGIAHREAFPQVQRHGFLEIKILAGPAGFDRLEGMPMGRGRDDDGIHVRGVDQFPPVTIDLARGLVMGGHVLHAIRPDIARGGDHRVGMLGAGA